MILRSRLFKRSGDKPRWHLLLPFLRVIKGFTFVSCRIFPLTLASFVTFSSELVTFAALLTQLLSGIVGPSAGCCVCFNSFLTSSFPVIQVSLTSLDRLAVSRFNPFIFAL